MARLAPGVLLSGARRLRAFGRRAVAHRRLAVRTSASRVPRLPAALGSDRHQCPRAAMGGVRDRRDLRRRGRVALRLLQGLDLAGNAVGAAFRGRARHGAPGRRANPGGSGIGRGALHMARGLGVARSGLLAQRHRRRDPPPCARTSPRHRRFAAQMVLSVERLWKAYGGVQAVRDVSFSVAAGEMVAIIGPNGAGKTTCFNMLNGQLSPDSGDIRLGGSSIARVPPHRIWRLGVGRTFQVTATFGSMSVRENVQTALRSFHRENFSFARAAGARYGEEADALLERVGMRDQGERACAVLAYGDLKRVELAVALANRPRLLLMDEPTAGMAPEERGALMQLVVDLARLERLAVLFTEHDMSMVFGYASRVIVLHQGEVIAEGLPEAVRNDARVREVYLGDA